MKTLFTIILAVVLPLYSFSQGCVMCSATIEANKLDGGNTGSGINAGVAYLSFFPYLMLAFFGFVFYKVYKKDKEKQQN